MENSLLANLSPYLFVLIWLLTAYSWTMQKGGFHRIHPVQAPPPPLPFLFFTLLCFLVYTILQVLIIPLTARFALCGLSDTCEVGQDTLTVVTDIGIALSALALTILSLLPRYRELIWGINRPWRLIPKGAAWWLLAFPLAILLGATVKLALELLIEFEPSQQLAVKFLKNLQEDRLLFAINAAAIATLVPLSEEILFRGCLFNFLKSILPFGAALFLNGVIFSLFHMDIGQGWSNAELLTALIPLGMILGWVYERERSLWASIGLHSIFNFFGVMNILLTGGE